MSIPSSPSFPHFSLRRPGRITSALILVGLFASHLDGYSLEAKTTAGAPAVPTSPITKVVTNTRVDLSWVDASDNEMSFEIERRLSGGSFSPLATVGAGVATYQDSTISPGTTYIYRVRAKNSGGNSAFSAETRITAGPPAAPTNMVAVASSNQISLSWTDVADSEVDYLIERGVDGKFTPLGRLPANSKTLVQKNLASNTYTYRICARNAAGSSAIVEASATTGAAPGGTTRGHIRLAQGTYRAEETIALSIVPQNDGSVRIRDGVNPKLPAGYQKYYIVNDTTYSGELEKIGTFQPHVSVTIFKIIAKGDQFWQWPKGDPQYIKENMGGAAEVFTGAR